MITDSVLQSCSINDHIRKVVSAITYFSEYFSAFGQLFGDFISQWLYGQIAKLFNPFKCTNRVHLSALDQLLAVSSDARAADAEIREKASHVLRAGNLDGDLFIHYAVHHYRKL